jgi:hypothetical protein
VLIMSRRVRAASLFLVGAVTFLSGLAAGLLNRFGDDRVFYKPILGVYNSGFFVEYDQAKRQGASWLKDDRAVATRYIQAVDYCPIRTVRSLGARAGRAVWIIEDDCISGMFSVKNRRVDLMQQAGVWAVEWVGVKYKCSRAPNDLGDQLVVYNPLRQSHLPIVAPINQAVQQAAPTLNLWHTTCP